MDADDNLIEARLRQLQRRTHPLEEVTGEAEPFWPAPVTVTAPPPANRWLGPLLGVLVGFGLTQMMASFGSTTRETPRPAAQNMAVTPDPTTQTLAKLIAAPAKTAAPVAATGERAINRNEYKELLTKYKLSAGRPDPFAEVDATPPLPALPPVTVERVIVPEPPQTHMAPTAPPVPMAMVRFSGSLTSNDGFMALVEETNNGQSASQRWRVGDLVLGGYRVAEITLKAVKLRWGGETHWLALGNALSLPRRSGESSSGLSALAPEPAQARRAEWRTPVQPRASMPTPVAPPSVRTVPPAPTIEPPLPVETVPTAEPNAQLETPSDSAAETGSSPNLQ